MDVESIRVECDTYDMKQHKWHKEIKAWADGAEIEFKADNGRWFYVSYPVWNSEEAEYRIKPQPITEFTDKQLEKIMEALTWAKENPITQSKEPKYIYVWKCEGQVLFSDFNNVNEKLKTHYQYIGKIKLEDDDGNA